MGVASGAFLIGVVLTAIFIQQSSRPSPDDILADARSLDEVQDFISRHPDPTEWIATSGGLANVLFISRESSEFKTCPDEFCDEALTVRPYIRVIADATDRGSYFVYCGFGTFTLEGDVIPVQESRPFDEKNSRC